MRNYAILLLIIAIGACAITPVAARQEVLVNDGGATRQFDATTGAYIGLFFGGDDCMAAGPDGVLYSGHRGSQNIWRVRISTGEWMPAFTGVQSGLSGCSGLTVGPDGKLYVSDTYNNRILRFDTATGASQVVHLSQTINDPRGIAFGPNGDLYVGGYQRYPDYCVARYSAATGQLVETYLASSSLAPTTLVAGPNGDIYAMGQCGGPVYRLNPKTKGLDTFAPWTETSTELASFGVGPDGRMFVATWRLPGSGNLMTYNSVSGTYQPFTTGDLLSNPRAIIVTDVVPEPGGILPALMALGAFSGMLRRRR
jgi:streptogramin lyase